MKNTMELLSPAGSEAALRAAVQSGADAVYIGGMKFGARHSAKNFTVEDIRRQCEYCHLYGVDVHVTVNTLIKERELGELLEYVYSLNDAGADALIIQDIGAAEAVHRALPDMKLHASTQMTVTSLEGVKYLESMGFSRVVLARELDKREIQTICAGAKAEIEVFAHGAICMCYSGQCLMSSVLGGRSGNRGRCAQPCRLPYTLTDGKYRSERLYALSPRDMALVKHLNELREMGVASIKIEGRLKRPEYVSAVTGIYRKYLDSGCAVSKQDMRELHDAFSRSGFTDGYFTNRLGSEMMSYKNPGNEGNVFTDDAKKRARADTNIRKIPVSVFGAVHIGSPAEVTAYDDEGHCAAGFGESAVRAAQKRPMDDERFRAQLAKTGATPFEIREMYTDIDDNAAVSIKDINKARRDALNGLARQRSHRSIGRKCAAPLFKGSIKRAVQPVRFSAQVRNIEQGRAAALGGIDIIYAPYSAALQLKREFPDKETVTLTEDIFRPERAAAGAVTVSSGAAREYYKNSGLRLYGTHRLNIFNSLSLEHYRDFELVTLSPELRLSEIREIAEHTAVPFELIGYGRLPLMLMRNCPVKAMGRCQKNTDTYSLSDRRGESFPVICRKGCTAELLNSKPLFMADRLNDLAGTGADVIKLIFTTETPSRCARIIKIYNRAKDTNAESMRENTFTRGHYYRGVE